MCWSLILSVLAGLVVTTALAVPLPTSELAVQSDTTYPCICIDHWFKHEREWIRASSRDGCMALETSLTVIWFLNKLEKPSYVSRDYPNLVCSMSQEMCQWKHSPLDYVGVNSSASVNTTVILESASQADSQFASPPCEVMPETIGYPDEPDLEPDQEIPASVKRASDHEEDELHHHFIPQEVYGQNGDMFEGREFFSNAD